MNETLSDTPGKNDRIGVMQGRLSDFDLGQVLQVVGIGRQYVGVEVHNSDAVAGTIYVKSGKVVSASAAGKQGKEAFLSLFQQGDGSFHVFRSATPGNLPEPIGALSGLVLEALSAEPDPSEFPTRGGVAPPASGSAPSAFKPPYQVDRTTGSPDAGAISTRVGNTAAAFVGASTRRVVCIASPKGGCGKTTISLNLGLALARQGRSIMLIDADVNGDVLSSVNARHRAEAGVFDVLVGTHSIEQTLLKTVVPGFSILPAVGKHLPRPDLFLKDWTPRWREMLAHANTLADLVLVDTPAGMFGITHQILAASTHVLGVLQAEVLANRSFTRFGEGIEALPQGARPKVAGVFLNMVQMRQSPSLSVLQDACTSLPPGWLFDTSIPDSPAFLAATDEGLPLRHLDELAPPAVAFLFDNLASEVAGRLELQAAERKPQAFLL